MMKGLQVLGCPVAIHSRLDPELRKKRLKSIENDFELELLRPHISHQYKLSQVYEALSAKWNRKVTGHCIIEPTSVKFQ